MQINTDAIIEMGWKRITISVFTHGAVYLPECKYQKECIHLFVLLVTGFRFIITDYSIRYIEMVGVS